MWWTLKEFILASGSTGRAALLSTAIHRRMAMHEIHDIIENGRFCVGAASHITVAEQLDLFTALFLSLLTLFFSLIISMANIPETRGNQFAKFRSMHSNENFLLASFSSNQTNAVELNEMLQQAKRLSNPINKDFCLYFSMFRRKRPISSQSDYVEISWKMRQKKVTEEASSRVVWLLAYELQSCRIDRWRFCWCHCSSEMIEDLAGTYFLNISLQLTFRIRYGAESRSCNLWRMAGDRCVKRH